MLELLLCSMLTILPDYLYRRFVQGKRLGKEITFFSMWFELRWGLTACLMLTVSLITAIFYFHPSTTSAAMMFRTVPIVPETIGRVAEVNVGYSEAVKQGQVLFRLDSAKQQAAVETAERKIAEIDASMIAAKADLAKAEGQVVEAKGAYQQAVDELEVKRELQRRNPGIVAQRDIEKLEVTAAGRQGSVDAALAVKQSVETRITALLPAEKASAAAALGQARVELDKTIIRAGIDGRVEQFLLKQGDVVNPLMRPAGILIPQGSGERVLQAGFGQIEAQVMRVGMVAEATCMSKPWVVIPLVVTGVQNYIAAGQFRGGEQLFEAQNNVRPGTVLVFLEPLYKDGLDGVTPGSTCVANAYTSNHDEIDKPGTSTARRFYLHAIDTVGVVHALLLRIQALMLPIQTLVLSGH